jgi:hypothetical protein
MAPAIPIIGIGLSAAGTLSGISAQNKQARAAEESREAAAADAKQRIALARDEMKFVRQQAARIRDQERLVIKAQRQQDKMQIASQVLQNEFSKVQSDVAATQSRFQAETFANQLLTQATGEKAQAIAAGTSELEQIQGEAPVPVVPGVSARAGAKLGEEQANVLTGQLGRAASSRQAREGVSTFNLESARQIGDIQKNLGNLAAVDIQAQQEIQNQLTQVGAVSADKISELQRQRNRKASQAKFFSTAATGTIQQLSAQIQEREQLRALDAQGRPQKAGVLSYLTGIGSVLNQGLEAGLFTQQAATQSASPLAGFAGAVGGSLATTPIQQPALVLPGKSGLTLPAKAKF